MSMMGELAALDALPDVGNPLIGDGGQFSKGLPAVNRLAERLPEAMLGGLGADGTDPRRADES